MFRLNYLVRKPISYVCGPWRATADLVRGHVLTMPYRLCAYIYTCVYIYIYVHVYIYVL